MKYIIVLIITTSIAYGQRDSTRNSFNIIYGQKYLSNKTFDGRINSLENINFGAPLTYIGFGTSGNIPINRRKLKRFGQGNYTQIIPQKILVNDTTSANITGFNFGFTFLGVDAFPEQKNFDIFISLGANTGRLRIYGNSYVNQKNPYFSPKISLTPRVIIRNICLQIQIDYEVDISKKNWRRTNFSDSPKINLPQTSNTGVTILTSIGYVLSTKNKKGKVESDEE